MSTKHQFINVKLPGGYSPDVLEAIGTEIISQIRKRTFKNNVDKNGDPFPEYSTAYKKSVDYKAAGKSGRVNLTLSGDMLAALEVLEVGKNKLKIGYQNGTTENGKADGNIRGTYGKPRANPKKARDFLGISDDELNKILEKYPVESNRAEARANAVLTADALIEKRLKNVNLNELSSKEVAKFFELKIGKNK